MRVLSPEDGKKSAIYLKEYNFMNKKNKVDDSLLWDTLKIDSVYNKDIVDNAYKKIKNSKGKRSQAKLAWKILRDPFFGSAYKSIKSTKKIFEAGFFEDNANLKYSNKERESPSWLATPTYKIIKQLEKIKKKKKKSNKPYVVLLSTGAFSPIHEGHVKMMEIAREELVKRGFEVIGGYISPSHDGYVSIKDGGEAKLDAALRLELCKLALYKNQWIMIDPWEALYADFALNYSDVIIRLENYLNVHIKADKPIDVVYVFGSDNANFARAFINKGKCVCVKRRGYDKKIDELKKEPWILNNNRIMFSKGYTGAIDVSSNLIRKGNKLSDERLQKSYDLYAYKKRETKIDKRNYLYIIRNDSEWATQQWQRPNNAKNMQIERDMFLKGLAQLIDGCYKKENNTHQINLKICFLDLKQQYEIVRRVNNRYPTISLDVCCKGRYNLDISRIFAISNDQYEPELLMARPGKVKIEDQIRKIPKGRYVLIEDDIASSATINFVKGLLKKDIKIVKLFILSKVSQKKFFINSIDNSDNLPIFDVVDFRDFLAGSKDGGLAVYLPNGKIARAPYVLPYVSLVTRAKLPAISEMKVSEKLWEMNEKFFHKIKPAIKLKDTDKMFQNLMRYIGFTANTPMEHICGWHKKRFQLL